MRFRGILGRLQYMGLAHADYALLMIRRKEALVGSRLQYMELTFLAGEEIMALWEQDWEAIGSEE